MMVAVVLVACEAGKYTNVAKTISKMKDVKICFPVFGRWDAVAMIEAEDLAALSKVVLKINGLPEVRATETLVQAVVE